MCACDRGRGWGWTVYTDIGDNESWHRAKLPSGETTIVHAVSLCVRDVQYLCARRRGGRRGEDREDKESQKMTRQLTTGQKTEG